MDSLEVVGSAALLLLINEVVVRQFIGENTGNTSSDPTRIIQAIVVGVSFIGAGTILKSNKNKEIFYLTTAGSILFTSTLGIVLGLGLYAVGITLAVILIGSLYTIGLIEKKWLNKSKNKT